ncbi:MAG: Rieske 2Fe-2S domain-containing protein [Deltaproteobacteria bacterium]|nr:Rieske 2Fe-2S domain-containing protein [Deltaproteobacteria bacterium]
MLSREENDYLTRVGPGTPCGGLLRRYWQPVAAASELTEDKPQKRVKIMGEELVLYRDGKGGYGLLEEHCSHRGTSLYYGFVEDGCIRCPYHGWLYNKEGRCVEQPFEPNPRFKDSIRHRAYPVEKLAGLLFAYLGPPDKKPLLPRWDILVWEHGERKLQIRPLLNCNWLQAEENTADFVHTVFLHGHMIKRQGIAEDVSFYTRPFSRYGFQPCEWGLFKTWEFEGKNAGKGWGNFVLFPNMLRQTDTLSTLHWRVPIDDYSTVIFHVGFKASPDGSKVEQPDEPPVGYEKPWINEEGEYHMKNFSSQDGMAWETQGRLYDRTNEHLGASDRGILMFREMLREQIQIVEKGGDPMALVWDPKHNVAIDLEAWTPPREARMGATANAYFGPRRSREEILDDRYEEFEVPVGSARPSSRS